MGNLSTMVVLFAEVVKSECWRACEHLELVDSLTDKPSHTPFPSEDSHGKNGQAPGSQSYNCTTNKQPNATNASRVSGDAGSVRTKRHKMKGAHRHRKLYYC